MTTVTDLRSRVSGSCRRCPIACDKVVYPVGCIESGCSRLYSYDEDGRTFIGCLENVYKVEIDRALLDQFEGERGGFGALRVMREPLPVCRTGVEETFPHRVDGPCLNPDFLFSAPRREFTVSVRREPAFEGDE